MGQGSAYSIDCRFNKATLVARIEAIARLRKRLTVGYGNAVTYLRRNHDRIQGKHSLVYIDPPYVRWGHKLYRYHDHEKDHRALAEHMDSAAFKWIVSYDNDPFVMELFRRQTIVPIFLNYAVKKSRKAEELLISNIRLIQPEYQDLQRRQRDVVRAFLASG
jgi:DNA adenine methylase